MPGVIRHAPPARAGFAVQGKFKILRGNDYTAGSQINEKTLRGKITGSLPSGVTVDAVVQKIKDWADTPGNEGTFTWPDLIDKAVKAVTPVSSAFDFAPFTPTWDGGSPPGTPTNTEYFTLARRMSQDFSDKMETEFGFNSDQARSSMTQMTHTSTGASGTTYGTGRFMTMTGPKVLGETRYADFLPKLPGLTGLSAHDVAQALLDGLLDGNAFSATLSTLDVRQQEALTKTVRLLNNEIIHRSSTNLLTIVGALNRTISDNSKTLATRLQTEGLFVPQGKDYTSKVGGQQLSAAHHTGSDVLTRAESELLNIFRHNKIAIGNLAEANGIDLTTLGDKCAVLIGQYFNNLKAHWTFVQK